MPGGALSTLLALASFSLASCSMTSVRAAASVAPSAAVSIAKTPHSPAQEQMNLIEHEMPIMAPQKYEPVLKEALGSRWSLIRWYIARVDEERGVAIAECVVLEHTGHSAPL